MSKPSEIVEKLRLVKEGEYDLDTFLRENEKMVHLIIHRYTGCSLLGNASYQDLFNEGLLGLYNAMLDFDENIGTDFWAFAYPYILNSVTSTYYTEFKKGGRQKGYDPIDGEGKSHLLTTEEKFSLNRMDELLEKRDFEGLLNEIDCTAKQREAMMIYLETMSFTETAKRLGVSKQSIHQRVEIVQQRLREKLYHS